MNLPGGAASEAERKSETIKKTAKEMSKLLPEHVITLLLTNSSFWTEIN